MCAAAAAARGLDGAAHGAGEGRALDSESVEVRIPPGASSGARLRVPGKGNAGSLGGPAGEVDLVIHGDPLQPLRQLVENLAVGSGDAGAGIRGAADDLLFALVRQHATDAQPVGLGL